jgi:hypothetical protein
MSYSLVHYLRNFPLRYYATGGLVSRNEPAALFFLSTKAASVLVMRHRRAVAYEDKIEEIPDHPPIPSSPGAGALSSTSRTFTNKLFARSHLHGMPKIVLVPDFGAAEDLYCNIHNTKNLRDYSVEGLLENLMEEPRQVIGAWDETREFRWSVLGANLQPVTGRIDRHHSHIMILGIPQEYCELCETWAEAQQGSLLGIIPAPIACLRWFIEKIPLGSRAGFLVLALNQTTVVAAVQNQTVTLIRQYDSEIDFVEKELATITAELEPTRPANICVWSAQGAPKSLASRFQGLALNEEAMGKIQGSEITVRNGNGTLRSVDDPSAFLLMWLESRIV